jgi:uncharacterized membrane protein YccC
MTAASGAVRARVRGWFTPTGAPPAWGLVRYLACGLFAGVPLSAALPDFRATLLGALTGAVVAAPGLAGPSRISRRVALITAAFSLGIVILFGGIGLSPAYPIVGRGLTSIGSILLAGRPTGDVAGWAGHRLIDTALGCAIALVATYLLWPRDRESEETVPAPAT